MPGGEWVPELSSFDVCWACIQPDPGPDLSSYPAPVEGFAACPTCGVAFAKPPQRASRCKACDAPFWVRRVPRTDDLIDRRILDAAGRDEAAALWAEDEHTYSLTITLRLTDDDDPTPVSPGERTAAIAHRGRCLQQYQRREAEWLIAEAGGAVAWVTFRRLEQEWLRSLHSADERWPIDPLP